jgi:hypothetical protein
MTAIQEIHDIYLSTGTSTHASQDELDELGLLLDRLDELEVYMDSPSITRDQKHDTWIEMESVMDRMDYYMNKV